MHDADGDMVTGYEFWDAGLGADSGYFRVNGQRQDAGVLIPVSAAQFTQTQFAGGGSAGAETLWVRATAGGEFSDWVSFTMTTTGSAPVATGQNRTIGKAQSIAAGSLFAIGDADGDAPAAYEFWDAGTAAESGRFVLNGNALAQGVALPITPTEFAQLQFRAGSTTGTETLWVRVADAGGFGAWASVVVTTSNQLPVVTAGSASVGRNAARAASGLFGVNDADNDAIQRYEFWDTGTAQTSGYFRVDGQAKAAGIAIAVQANQLNATEFVGGTGPGTETLWVRAFDGTDWSAWVSWSMSTTGSAPVARAADAGVHVGQSVAAAALFSVTDADGDTPVSYEFWDAGTAADSGRFVLDSTVLAQGVVLPISAGQLAQLSYRGGTVAGAETVWVRAADALGFGNWVGWRMNTGNVVPVVSAPSRSVGKAQVLGAAALFSVTDADGDTIQRYEFWDTGTAQTSGFFRIGGQAKAAGVAIPVEANQLGLTEFVGGTVAGTDTVWVRAFDGFEWSAWSSFALSTLNRVPTVSASNASVAWGQPTSLAPLLTASDPDGDAIAQYDFRDGGSAANSGYVSVAGVAQPSGQAILVPAAQLATMHFLGGTVAGGETLWVRVSDGDGWSDWAQLTMTTTGNAPVVNVTNATIGTGQSLVATAFISATDADGDTITAYEFRDGGTAGGHFSINGVEQTANVTVSVTASNLGQLSYTGGENPGAETLSARANDGSGWGPWTTWTMTTPIRFQEVIGTTGSDIFPPPPTSVTQDTIFFGLGGDDRYQASSGDEFMIMGGAGADSYWIPNFNDVFIIVYENGNSAGDFIQPGFTVPAANDPAPTAILATVDGRHLLLGDAAAGRLTLVIDWQQPANRIETWFIGGIFGGSLSYADFAAAVVASQLVNITIDELVAFDPVGLAGFGSAAFNEMLAYYAQRESRIANNVLPVIHASYASVRSGQSIPLTSLFSVSDANGDAIQRYEVFMGYNSTQPGHITINGAIHNAQTVIVEAADLANARYVATNGSELTHDLQVRAHDGIAWGAQANVGADITVNHAPTIAFFDGNMQVPLGRSVPVSTWFRAIDRNGDVITHYEFTEGSATPGIANGHFELNGVTQISPFVVTAAELDALIYVVPSDGDFFEQISVSAFDGEVWGDEPSNFLDATASGNRTAELRLTSTMQFVSPGQPVAVSNWFNAVDPDGDSIAEYRLFDHNGTPTDSGHFRISGIAQDPQVIVTPAGLGSVTYAPDPDVPSSQPWSVDAVSLAATETAGVFFADAGLFIFTTSNRRPTLTATDATVGLNQTVSFTNLVSLVTNDPDGDSVSSYTIEDLGVTATSGYFVLNNSFPPFGGSLQPGGMIFTVYPSTTSSHQTSLAQLRYRGGSVSGTETIRIRADTQTAFGTSSSDWVTFSIRSGPAQADGAGNSQGAARVVSVGAGTTQSFDDAVGDSDTADYYRLDVAAPGNLLLALTQLGGNADLQLLDNAGNVLANSLNPDNWSERITHIAAAGSYYARIVPVGGHDTSYHLAVSLV